MSTQDLHSHVKDKIALNGAVIGSSTTTHGVIIDTQGYEGIEFVLRISAWTDGTFTASLTEGDASDLSGGTVATALLGSFPALGAANTSGRFGYRGHKRYVRLDVVSTGVTSGAHVSGVALLAFPNVGPTT